MAPGRQQCPRLRRRPYLSVIRNLIAAFIGGFKTLHSHLALPKLPVLAQAFAANTKRVYDSVTRRRRRTTSSTRAQQQELGPQHSIVVDSGLDCAMPARFPIPNRTLCTHAHPAATLGSSDQQQPAMVPDDRGVAFDDHLIVSNPELLGEKGETGMAFPNLLPVRRCGCRTLRFMFNVRASLEAVVSVREVVEFDGDDESDSKVTVKEVEVQDNSGDGFERDDNDNVPLDIVKYHLAHQSRAQATKSDAKVAEISPKDRYISAPSCQITPTQNGFRNCMRPRSNNIQIAARSHAVEQQLRARSTAKRQEELPEPIGKTRPPVLSGLGISSPLRNGWTTNDV